MNRQGGKMPATRPRSSRLKSMPNSTMSLLPPPKNGQTKRHVLEQALKFYLRNVVPSQHLVLNEVMDAFEQSVAHNRDLLQRLAK